ncbi:hypothetical protein IIA_02176 [Bacillus cereus VD014]|uniref:Uncharacterized protein n=1 Tax=Bacillus cereus (strain VD014) TaxID=1053223 RepID=A0A9W5K962_BACC8|nr:hypothetical protein IIA_02176 [Bacillus cereus VD014]PNK36283.1 hypothetical protein CBR55_21225 [Bacillus thuringiensis]
MLISQVFCFYPVICRAVRPPPQNLVEAKKLGGGWTARKSPIGESSLKFHFINEFAQLLTLQNEYLLYLLLQRGQFELNHQGLS